MNARKFRLLAIGKNSIAAATASNRMIVTTVLLLLLSAGFAPAQTENFNQTGQIRVVVSETEAPARAATPLGFDFSGSAKSKTDFYFVYSIVENGAASEKWTALSADRDWSRFSNQAVRITGSFNNEVLSNAAVSPLARLPETALIAPPPTTGLYKIAAVPLTIQPTSVSGKSAATAAALTVTPEAIRHNLFNAPNAVNKFYREASYGMLQFTGVHHPQADVVPVTIQAAISANCQDQIINDFTATVRQRLLEQNINTTNGSVDLGIIIFNDLPGCPPYPFATRGALGARGVPQWLWIPQSWFVTGPSILAHEMAHMFGGNHPYVFRCSDFDNSQTCAVGEADDRDLMTYGGRFYMMPNNYERRRWGWHPPSAFVNASSGLTRLFDLHAPILPFIKDGAKQGRFYFRSLNGVHAGWDVYPETRRNWGQFEQYPAADEAFRAGIAVRIGHSNFGDPEALSVLLDPNATVQFEDAPLRANQQVRIGGVTIKCLREHNPRWGTRMSVQE